MDFEIITEEEFSQSSPSSAQSPPPDEGEQLYLQPCEFCGWCLTPGDCAWAHDCPKCGAPAGPIGERTYCKTPTGAITGLHAERWEGGAK